NVIVLQETIISPEQLDATGIVKQASCLGNDGAISLNVLGGEAPYDYQWNNGATAKDISGLSAGNYDVTITDINGCTVQAAFNIIAPLSGMELTAAITPASCGKANGSLNLSIAGGLSPYQIIWSNGATTEVLESVAKGT